MFLLNEVTNDLRLALTAVRVNMHTGHHLRTGAWAAFSEGVGFDILIQQLVAHALACSRIRSYAELYRPSRLGALL